MKNKSRLNKVMEMAFQCDNMRAAKAMIDFAHPDGEMTSVAALFFFEEDKEFADLVSKFLEDMKDLKARKER